MTTLAINGRIIGELLGGQDNRNGGNRAGHRDWVLNDGGGPTLDGLERATVAVTKTRRSSEVPLLAVDVLLLEVAAGGRTELVGDLSIGLEETRDTGVLCRDFSTKANSGGRHLGLDVGHLSLAHGVALKGLSSHHNLSGKVGSIELDHLLVLLLF